MKKAIFALLLTLSALNTYAQDKVIKDTTINKTSFKMYEGARGGRYIIVTSKAGKDYKRYFKTKTR
jgi:hypothetical protein